MLSYDPQFDPPFWGVRVDLGDENVIPTFLFDFHTHNNPILHRLATIHNAADRQTDREAAYAVGGPQ